MTSIVTQVLQVPDARDVCADTRTFIKYRIGRLLVYCIRFPELVVPPSSGELKPTKIKN
jgi:hypothetical protein